MTASRSQPGSAHSGFWETHKDVLDYLWQQRNLNLNDLRSVVLSVYGFQASAKQYKVHFLGWGWRKFDTSGTSTPRPVSRGGPIRGDPNSLDVRKRLPAALSRARAIEDIHTLRASLGHHNNSHYETALVVDNNSTIDQQLLDHHHYYYSIPGAGFSYFDETTSRIALIHGDIIGFLHSCFQHDGSWASVSKYELLGRCQSMVTRALAYAVMLAADDDAHTSPDRFRLFVEIAFCEMERELNTTYYSSLQMWDLIINVPQLLLLEGRLDILDEYLVRLQRLCRGRGGNSSSNPSATTTTTTTLERAVATLLAIVRDGGQDGVRAYITTTAPVWADTVRKIRGGRLEDRTVLDAIGTSMFISGGVTGSDVEKLCRAYNELARQAHEEHGPLHDRTLSQRNAFLNVQAVFNSFLPDFSTRSFSLLTKLHRKNAPPSGGRSSPAHWPDHDRFVYFRTYYRLCEYYLHQGNDDLARVYLAFCDAVPHDLRFRGISMQLGDVRLKMMALKDIHQYRKYSCYQNLPDPYQVNSCEELRALMEMSLLQYAIPN